MSTVTRAYLDQRLAMAKRCSRGKAIFSFSSYSYLLPYSTSLYNQFDGLRA